MSEIAEKVRRDLESKGYEVRLNPDRTNVQLKTCVRCGNDRWNLDIEVENKFFFNCWACGYSGASRHLLQRLNCAVFVAAPLGQNIEFSPKTDLYFNYPTFAFDTPEQARIIDLKRISPKKPVYFNGSSITNGRLLLGTLGQGVMITDETTKKSFCTCGDLYVYNRNPNRHSIVVVEGFYDIFPFFSTKQVLVLSGTTLKSRILQKSRDFFDSLQKIYVALDQEAEKPFIDQLYKLQTPAEIYILHPDKHSPSESSSLVVKHRFSV